MARDSLHGASLHGSASPLRVLRLSLSARADFRCSCCAREAAEIPDGRLDARQLLALVAAFARLGVRDVRLAGAGPASAPDLPGLVEAIRRVPGIEAIAVTTNGQHLAVLARRLRAAGASRLTVVVDTLDPVRLRALHGRSASLVACVQGVEAAAHAGFDFLKLDTVVIRDVNDRELPSLVRFAWRHGAIARLIQLMPYGRGDPVPVAEMKERLVAHGMRLRPDSVRSWGPAECLRGEDADGAGGALRLVGPMPYDACRACNRVRVGPDGTLRACLGRANATPLAALLRAGTGSDELSDRIASALARPAPIAATAAPTLSPPGATSTSTDAAHGVA